MWNRTWSSLFLFLGFWSSTMFAPVSITWLLIFFLKRCWRSRWAKDLNICYKAPELLKTLEGWLAAWVQVQSAEKKVYRFLTTGMVQDSWHPRRVHKSSEFFFPRFYKGTTVPCLLLLLDFLRRLLYVPLKLHESLAGWRSDYRQRHWWVPPV